VFQALYEWFKKTPFTNLKRNYLALGEVVGKEAFNGRMRRLFEDAISREEWNEDKRKPGYSAWMEDKLVDVLYNTQPFLDRYMKLQTVPMNNEELVAFKSKVEKRRIGIRSHRKVVQLGNKTPCYGNDAARWPLDPFQRQDKSVVSEEENGRWLWNNSKVFH
jgi:hypothetical protein